MHAMTLAGVAAAGVVRSSLGPLAVQPARIKVRGWPAPRRTLAVMLLHGRDGDTGRDQQRQEQHDIDHIHSVLPPVVAAAAFPLGHPIPEARRCVIAVGASCTLTHGIRAACARASSTACSAVHRPARMSSVTTAAATAPGGSNRARVRVRPFSAAHCRNSAHPATSPRADGVPMNSTRPAAPRAPRMVNGAPPRR